MCKSFVLHRDPTIIGMNFDISERPIKMILQKDSQFVILQKENGAFLPAFGLNARGTFMNLLMVNPNEEGKYRRGKHCVHILKLFDEVLSDKVELPMLADYLNDHTIVNVPDYSVQSMITGMNRNTYIVEPGKSHISIKSTNRDFMVLTNFSLIDQMEKKDRDVIGHGNGRYSKAYDMISTNKEIFKQVIGFSVLKETAQYGGEYPTQLSMISIAEEGLIYFTLNGDFNKIFEFSFRDKQIRTTDGFINSTNCTLSKKRVLLEELKVWE